MVVCEAFVRWATVRALFLNVQFLRHCELFHILVLCKDDLPQCRKRNLCMVGGGAQC
jgi:hypothetical protein